MYKLSVMYYFSPIKLATKNSFVSVLNITFSIGEGLGETGILAY